MPTGPTPPRTFPALVTGVATTLHYALPDLVPSRTARGWTKAGITAVALAAAFPDLRATWATTREQLQVDGEPVFSTAFSSLPVVRQAVVLGIGAAVLAGSAGGVLAGERWAFRRGEARAAAGKRLPHTGPALVYGALAGVLWLLPPPEDPH
ncbi:hypothetical protein [Blastococcus sp. VKM Ac-2987]|uniref:hypothetical protein n=1 Tax=Blastococcus sp. VKM Ac-2987 TaxID=3004141 RepID=UPI0022AB6A6F|nr:hypothetical protein [Blastococcus sp. VKM Ac-2987]MCZ2860652.1 hypothetical protein [Blastococcus sp. VKM Ac-2987]